MIIRVGTATGPGSTSRLFLRLPLVLRIRILPLCPSTLLASCIRRRHLHVTFVVVNLRQRSNFGGDSRTGGGSAWDWLPQSGRLPMAAAGRPCMLPNNPPVDGHRPHSTVQLLRAARARLCGGCGRRWVYWVLLVKRVELAPFAIEEVGVESACYARGLESLGVPPEVGGCFGKRLAVGVLEDRNLPLR